MADLGAWPCDSTDPDSEEPGWAHRRMIVGELRILLDPAIAKLTRSSHFCDTQNSIQHALHFAQLTSVLSDAAVREALARNGGARAAMPATSGMARHVCSYVRRGRLPVQELSTCAQQD